MSIYKGTRTPQGCVVTVDGEPLDPRLDLYNHSLTGFEWGFAGSGPAQLALAILAHHYRESPSGDGIAIKLYQSFKLWMVAKLPRESFEIDENQISLVIRQIRESYQRDSGTYLMTLDKEKSIMR